MRPIEARGAGAVGPVADVVLVTHGPGGAGSGADSGAPAEGSVAVIRTRVPSTAGGADLAPELVDRLVSALGGPRGGTLLPADVLVRTGPRSFVIVCSAPAGQRRVMAVVDEIRATVLDHLGPGFASLPGLSIGVALAGSVVLP
jgi:hypothetical protein